MHFISTRNIHIRKTLTEAIRCGLAEDGGLFVPEFLPKMDFADFSVDLNYVDFAKKLLQPFFRGDDLETHLFSICRNSFNFPIPLQPLNDNTFMLELFHGPTSSFKDVGARFLAECLNAITEQKKMTIMVATSGDTGSAVASAFYKKDPINVIILYPNGQISRKQEQQITCWNDNVLALAVNGTFDDCQKMVKTAFQDPWWQQRMHISSANSINIGRLLPQMTYYAYTSTQFYLKHQKTPGFIVPTGNLGNATAAYWAKEMGFPIREIVLATNANRVIEDYLEQGLYQPRQSVSTLANAMDVGHPSNFERLQYLLGSFENFKKNVQAVSVSDDEIKKTITKIYQQYQMIICPHTATGCFARQQLSDQHWIVVATADPAKFDNIIEPIIQRKVPITVQLQSLLDRPTHKTEIEASLEAVKNICQK